MYIDMRRTKEEAAITRQQLLNKGLAVFSKKGYAATTLADIAREADVTPIGVTTGIFSAAELESSGAYQVVPDLNNADAILGWMLKA
jgi:hypothetical protein